VSQAQAIIRKFGGVPALAKATELSLNSVYKWTYPKERGGTGGLIPTDKLPVVLDAAKARGIEITVDDLRGSSQEAAE
jgi:hypothetical protein